MPTKTKPANLKDWTLDQLAKSVDDCARHTWMYDLHREVNGAWIKPKALFKEIRRRATRLTIMAVSVEE